MGIASPAFIEIVSDIAADMVLREIHLSLFAKSVEMQMAKFIPKLQRLFRAQKKEVLGKMLG